MKSHCRTKGSIFILTSAFFYASYGIWSKLMSTSFNEFSQAWTRGLLLTAVILLINFKYKILRPVKKQDWIWFIIIALAGGLNKAPYFFGFKHLDIGTATLLFYAALVIGGYIIGKLAFNEKLTEVKLFSLTLAVIGMLTIYKLTLSPNQFLAAGLTVVAGLMGSCTVALSKKLSGNYEEVQIMLGYFIVMIFANSLLGFLFHESLPSISNTAVWIAWLGYAASMLIANWAAIEGFKYVSAIVGSLIGLAEILFGILFGIIIFGEVLTIGTVLGAMLIIVSASLPNLIKNWDN